MLNKYLIVIYLLSISLTARAETAATNNNEPDMALFDKLDINGDKLISHEEAYKDEGIIKNWDKLDTNVDGKLDSSEYANVKPIIQRIESQKTDHPVAVEQYENGKYISPEKQIERNIKEGK